MMNRIRFVLALLIGVALATTTIRAQNEPTATETNAPPVQTGYASVNGLEMYYEIHGTGEPLVVLHGSYMSIDAMAPLIIPLAQTRQVIAVELQGHGRTADIERPITFENLADDVAALLAELGIPQADIFGYSLGGSVALQVAIRHPEAVRKLVITSATYNSEGWHPELHELIKTITPELFAGSPMETEYLRLAPNPENWPTLVNKLVALDSAVQDWPAEDVQAIEAPALIIVADSDQVRLEHAVEMFRLFGGGVPGDLVGQPASQLAIIPGTTHVSVMFRADLLLPLITEFLAASLSE